HLHLLCDFVGSRGPSSGDLWPILYFAPFLRDPVWVWSGQWRLDGWQNKLFTLALMLWIFQIVIRNGTSVVRIFNQRADAVFVYVLQGWWTALRWKHVKDNPQSNPKLSP